MKMEKKFKKPVYDMIFEYLNENYEFKAVITHQTKFWKKDIYENQLKNLNGPLNPEKIKFKNINETGKTIIEFAKNAGADLTGFTKIKDHFVFEGVKIQHKFAVVLGIEMNYENIMKAPEPESSIEVLNKYWRLGYITNKVAEFIRFLGYPAIAHHPRNYTDYHPTILHTVAAIEAGFGELGRNGLLITKEFGPRVRVSTVTTDLELPQSQKNNFGVDEFCKTCNLCIDACEGDAIPKEKIEVRGHLIYTIDPYKCLPYFAEYDDCNLCVSKCAFNKPKEKLKKFINSIN